MNDCDCPLSPFHRWNCESTPVWAQTIRALDCNPWLVFQKPINPIYQDPLVPSYGYPDASCHCYVDPCNCGDDRAAHGHKPKETT